MKIKSSFKQAVTSRDTRWVLSGSVVLILLCIVFSVLNDGFRSDRNMVNILRQIAPILIVGIGQSYVMITGNIDLSIGGVYGMSCLLSAAMMSRGVANPWTAVFITIICCLAIGVVNAVLVSNFKLPSFFVTLSTMYAARCVAKVANGYSTTFNINSVIDASLFEKFFYSGKTLGIVNSFWIAVALLVIFSLLLSRTRGGKDIYAVGRDIESARRSGVNVNAAVMKAYLASSFCACVAGLIHCATADMGAMDAGTYYEMYALAASAIGGVSIFGGQGILLGTAIGASICGVLQNGLLFHSAYVTIRNGAIIAIAVISVLLDSVIRRNRKEKVDADLNQATEQV